MNVIAVYASKSTDQLGLTNEQKSVARQVEHARAYAARKGWTVPDECVFVDDAVSGAEFATRPGFVRLMAALKLARRSRSSSCSRNRGSGASRSKSPTR